VNENSCSFYTSYCDVALEEGARCSYSALLEGAKQGWHFDYLRATLKRSSTFKGVSWTSGGKTMRQDMHLMLAGENAEVDLRGGWLLEEKHQAHTHVRIDHQFPHCRSLQRFKGVVKGNSRSSFAGKICVAKEAQKTEAYQVNHNLVLDKGAIAYSMPNLEIFADDVKASHGSTVSQIDPTQLFYMQTRGIDECTAKKWLTMGFCQEIINQISIEGVRCQAQQIVQGAGHGCL
jgi:Fe-S cluster assembly protein SufD